MDRIGQELLDERKTYFKGTKGTGDTWCARDLLSLMVQSNMSKNIPENQRMSDKDIIARTF